MEAWVIVLTGAILIGIGVLFQRHQKKNRKICTVQTTGEVVDNERRVSVSTSEGRRKRSVSYYPVFRFQVEERTMEMTSTMGTSWKRFKRGRAVTVCYEPGNPARYYVKEDKMVGAFYIIFIAIGLMLWIGWLLSTFMG